MKEKVRRKGKWKNILLTRLFQIFLLTLGLADVFISSRWIIPEQLAVPTI